MAAAIRLSRRNLGLTSTNPSVGALIVRDDGNGPVIVGSGVTAIGGRPHAEPQALAEAGELARGATAYVTLEPCAHHGHTPPCANTLVSAGVTRVVGAAIDHDPRVSGKGYAILCMAGIEVREHVLSDVAADQLAGYLNRSVNKRPEVILKLALSADGMIGRRGNCQVGITGEIARRQVHVMRAECDAILIGIGTAIDDDPELTVRLPGLRTRSPTRIILDSRVRLPVTSKLAMSANDVPVLVVACSEGDSANKAALERSGVRFLVIESFDDRVALPTLLEDLANQGMSRILVEGGTDTARAFLDEGLIDRIALFYGPEAIGTYGITAPIGRDQIPEEFSLVREAHFGEDSFAEWIKQI